MKTSSILIASALFATGYSAAKGSSRREASPDDSGGSGKKFSLTQIRNEKFKLNPVEALARPYARYADKIPEHIQRLVDDIPELRAKFGSPSTDEKVIVSAEAKPPPNYDSEYVLSLSLGTPPQTVPINLDTGSSDLWVFASETNPTEVQNQTLYHPEYSSTSRKLDGYSWTVKYGDNSSASGGVYTDRAAIGPVAYDQQAVQVATEISSTIAADTFFSGILGMAASSANTVTPEKQLTFFDNVKGTLDKPLFTANLQRGRPGNYNFGYIDDAEYDDEIAYLPTEKSVPYWKVRMNGYAIGGDDDDDDEFVRTSSELDGIVDTGTTLTMLPSAIVNRYYANVPGSRKDAKQNVIMFPCSATLPDLTFVVRNTRIVVPGPYLNYAPGDGGYCYGGLQSSDQLPFPIFGDTFLKASFVVFDQGNMRVGFANKPTD